MIVEDAADPALATLRHAEATDLVVMGLEGSHGAMALDLARASEVPLVLVGGRRRGETPFAPRSSGVDTL